MPDSAKVFGVGLSKTGTTSLYTALAHLGYRAATFRHMRKLGLNEWREGRFDHDYLAEYDAVTDLPIAFYYRELDDRYPGSKFVLTTRDTESWLASIRSQFESNPDPGRFNRDSRLVAYGFSVFNEGAFRRRFLQHHDEVIAHFAERPDSLLLLNLFEGDGWAKLCQFLDRPVPDMPFPHVQPGHEPEVN